jgi:hypothetical protein
MHICFDISQTGTGKAGCGYFAHAMIRTKHPRYSNRLLKYSL